METHPAGRRMLKPRATTNFKNADLRKKRKTQAASILLIALLLLEKTKPPPQKKFPPETLFYQTPSPYLPMYDGPVP